MESIRREAVDGYNETLGSIRAAQLKDLRDLLKAFDIRLNVTVRDIVRKRWQLEPAPSNMAYWRYNVYQVDEEVGGQNCKGRYYTFTCEFVERLLTEKDRKR